MYLPIYFITLFLCSILIIMHVIKENKIQRDMIGEIQKRSEGIIKTCDNIRIKTKRPEFPEVKISSPYGILSVKSSDILNSKSGQRQLKALKSIKTINTEGM